jgi:hypothetical protein
MAYHLHFVPYRRSTEVVLSLSRGDGLGAPVDQRVWPNWVELIRALSTVLAEPERMKAKAKLAAGRAHLLANVRLTDRDLDALGF